MNGLSFRRLLGVVTLVAISFVSTGCNEYDPPKFHSNVVAMQQADRDGVVTDEQKQQIADVLLAMFGTPDEPVAFAETGLDLAKLRLAAGPVRSEKNVRLGLYREHCAHCHGITGDGRGPTAAFLNPYPRDYRQGIFKFKTTNRAAKPTDEDLRRIIHDGIPDTNMPSFALLPDDEIDALVEYVKYLSMRGQMELRLIRYIAVEGEDLEPSRELLVAGAEGEDFGMLQEIAEQWETASDEIIVPAELPEGLDMNDPVSVAASAARGKELFYGAIASCVKCHGNAAMGDGQATEPDDWSKDILPEDIAAGALQPRNIIPRNLRGGILRGGRRPLDIYARIHAGINGTPMPGLKAVVEAAEPAIQPEELWHIVNYVRTLPFEGGELARQSEPTVHRDRN